MRQPNTSLTTLLPTHAVPGSKIQNINQLATLPALFVSHGAPSLALEKSATTIALNKIGQNLPTPKAIIIMSAHWQSQRLEINSNPRPKTWHDFKGFDDSLYQIDYPALGHPMLAEYIAQQLDEKNIACSLNPIRAFDHGVWVPLKHLYPAANIPIVQLSLPLHFNAHTCYQLGALFAKLRQQQIMIIGSGSITHNLKQLRWGASTIDMQAKRFKDWLLSKLKYDVPSALDWQTFDGFELVHPTAEHLLPLFFALGAGQRVSVVHQSMVHHSLGMDILRFD